MKHFVIQIIVLVVVIALASWIVFSPGVLNSLLGSGSTVVQSTSNTPLATKQVQIVDPTTNQTKAVVTAEIADTQAARNKGLGGRSSLPENQGMLFVFSSVQKPTFWMKGMQFPLDFIWIRDNEVVDMLVNKQPPVPGETDDQLPQYAPITTVDKVLEVNAGFAQKYDINIGDKIVEE